MLTGVSTATSISRPPSRAAPKRSGCAATAAEAGGWAGALFRGIGQALRDPPQGHVFLEILLLPGGPGIGAPDLDGGDLVFRAVCRPVREVGGDDVGAGLGVVEGGVDDTRLHALGDHGPERDVARAAGKRDEIAVADTAALGVEGVDLQHVLVMPGAVLVAPRLRADIVLRQDAAGGEQQREAGPGAFL